MKKLIDRLIERILCIRDGHIPSFRTNRCLMCGARVPRRSTPQSRHEMLQGMMRKANRNADLAVGLVGLVLLLLAIGIFAPGWLAGAAQ